MEPKRGNDLMGEHLPCVDPLKHVLAFRNFLWAGVEGRVIAFAYFSHPVNKMNKLLFTFNTGFDTLQTVTEFRYELSLKVFHWVRQGSL